MFKKGDRVKDVTGCGSTGVVADINPEGELSIHWDGEFYDPTDTVYWPASDFVIEEPEGPVRTVTRKEILCGTYGPVTVTADLITVKVWRPDTDRSENLRKAAATLLTLAEALE